MEKERKVFKSIYTAEILLLVGLVVVAIAGVFFANVTDSASTITAGSVYTSGALGVVGALLCVVGNIMRLLGLLKGKDSSKYLNLAFVLVIVTFVLTVAGSVLPSGTIPAFISTRISNLSDAMDLIVAVCVITAIRDIAKAARSTDLAVAAQKTESVYFIIAILAIFSDVVSSIVTAGGVAAMALGIAYIVFVIAAYVMYLKLLKQAVNEL